MSDLLFSCPKCSKNLAMDDKGAGREIQCPDCHTPIVAPQPTIIFGCSSCKSELSAPNELEGMTRECPNCQKNLIVPTGKARDKTLTCPKCHADLLMNESELAGLPETSVQCLQCNANLEVQSLLLATDDRNDENAQSQSENSILATFSLDNADVSVPAPATSEKYQKCLKLRFFIIVCICCAGGYLAYIKVTTSHSDIVSSTPSVTLTPAQQSIDKSKPNDISFIGSVLDALDTSPVPIAIQTFKTPYWLSDTNITSAEEQYAIGLCYLNGRGVKKNESDAEEWFIRAALRGFTDAQIALGRLYSSTETFKHHISYNCNRAAAFRWCTKAAEQGNAEAQFVIGKLCYSRDDKMIWFRKAAEQGNADAQLELGKLCSTYMDHNINVKQMTWFRKAAEQGNAEAQGRLGSHLLFSDLLEARTWLRKAAEQGNAEAQCRLGDSYSLTFENGSYMAVNIDYFEALKWYLKSAEKGNRNAQVAIFRTRAYHSNFPIDSKSAYGWLILSGVQPTFSIELDLIKSLTPLENQEAHNWAEGWKFSHGTNNISSHSEPSF